MINSNPVVLVEFYASWCPHCKRMMPVVEQVKELLLQAGMEFVAAYDAFTHDSVTAESERMYIIARPKVI